MKYDFKVEKILNLFKSDRKTFVVACIGVIVILIIMASELIPHNNKNDEISTECLTTDYCSSLENKVEEIISLIDGAGKTRVMITLSETTEYIYAKNESNQNKSSDNTINTDNEKDYVIIEQNNEDAGLLIKTIEPKIRGVAIVCEGGDNTTVQQDIYSTVSAVLNVSTARISISKLNNSEDFYEK